MKIPFIHLNISSAQLSGHRVSHHSVFRYYLVQVLNHAKLPSLIMLAFMVMSLQLMEEDQDHHRLED